MRPKIIITKLVKLDNKEHYRFYSPYYEKGMEHKPKVPVYNLDPKTEYHRITGEQYSHLGVQTEKQLAKFIHNKYGTGKYRCLAYPKGRPRRPMYIFWEGIIESDGWTTCRLGKKNIAETFKFDNENPFDECEDEVADDDTLGKRKRYGFAPFLNPSGKKGEKHYWNDSDQPCTAMEVVKEKTQTLRLPSKTGKKASEMSIDELNDI